MPLLDATSKKKIFFSQIYFEKIPLPINSTILLSLEFHDSLLGEKSKARIRKFLSF